MIRLRRNSLWFLLGVLVLSRLGVLFLLPEDARSIDLTRFEVVYRELEAGRNPYETTRYLNYAPLWMLVIWALGKVAVWAQVSLITLIQLLYILTEALILRSLYRSITAEGGRTKHTRILLWGFCLNPALILLTCQHGHFDVLVGLIVLLTLLWMEEFLRTSEPRAYLRAAALLGLGIFLKTVPFVLAPLFSTGIARVRRPNLFTAGALMFAPALVGLGALYVTAPEGLYRNVLMYTSVSGYFGFPGILEWAFGEGVMRLYKGAFVVSLLLLLLGLAVVARVPKRIESSTILPIVLFLLLYLIVLGPGYGPQYFYWIAPLLILAALRPLGRVSVLSLVVLFVAGVSYPFEYAVQPALGGFARDFIDPALVDSLKTKPAQTLLRLPLFLALIFLLVETGRVVVRRVMNSKVDKSDVDH